MLKRSSGDNFLYFVLYSLLMFSIEISYLANNQYVGFLIIFLSLFGALKLRYTFLELSKKLGDQLIYKNYRLSMLLIFLGILLGILLLSLGLMLLNFAIVLISVVVPYLLAVLSAYLFRESCVIVQRYSGAYSLGRLGNVSFIIALIYPAYFLLETPYSTIFLTALYLVLIYHAKRAFESVKICQK